MSLDAKLQEFYGCHGFGDTLGARPKTVPVYTGCMLVPLPNIEARQRYLKYHDLHHLITGYSVGRIGEGQISAWELGTGSMRESATLGLMNLIALSTGWVLDKDKMWAAFRRGRQSSNLYSAETRKKVDAGIWTNIEELQQATLKIKPEHDDRFADQIEFVLYVTASLVFHASIAIPAMIVRTVSDLAQGKSLSKTLSPSRRPDLF